MFESVQTQAHLEPSDRMIERTQDAAALLVKAALRAYPETHLSACSESARIIAEWTRGGVPADEINACDAIAQKFYAPMDMRDMYRVMEAIDNRIHITHFDDFAGHPDKAAQWAFERLGFALPTLNVHGNPERNAAAQCFTAYVDICGKIAGGVGASADNPQAFVAAARDGFVAWMRRAVKDELCHTGEKLPDIVVALMAG